MPLTREQREKVEQLKAYALSTDAFLYLRIDPCTREDRKNPDSLIVDGVLEDLRRLGALFWSQIQAKKVFHEVTRSLQLIWPTLVSWLQLLHPSPATQTSLSLLSLHSMCSLLAALYSLQGPAQKLRAESQGLCNLVFRLWLHFDEYVTEETDVVHCLGDLGLAVREAIFVDGKDRIREIIGDRSPGNDEINELYAAHISPVCATAVLAAVRYHPRRVYRQALAQIRLALARHTSVSPAVTQQLQALAEIACNVLPLLRPTRDIVHGFVSLMHTIMGREGGATWGSGVGLILAAFWSNAKDESSMVWALRAGILPLLLDAEDEKEKREIVAVILRNAYRIRVLRAMCADGGIPSFEGSGLQDDTCFQTRVDGWLQMRMNLMQAAYREVCANPECPSALDGKCISARRCPCFNAFYCSKPCQRAHWPLHKRKCLKGTEGTRYLIYKEGVLEPWDAHFVSLLTRSFVLAHAASICQSIHRIREELPPSNFARMYIMAVYLEKLPTTYIITHHTDDPEYPEDAVVVAALLGSRRGIVDLRVVSATVSWLEGVGAQQVAEGYSVADWLHVLDSGAK
ncbi:hypothetical protein K523DRAFT_287746 [Schizophyllum commune Tattone D]|nr:hypothetical protein K523DRAFT_287746 [Schizophyllum commune Tattone D]